MRRHLQESVNSRLKVPARQVFWLNPSDLFIVTIWGNKRHYSVRPGTQFRLPLSRLRAAHTGSPCSHEIPTLNLPLTCWNQGMCFLWIILNSVKVLTKLLRSLPGPLPLTQKLQSLCGEG